MKITGKIVAGVDVGGTKTAVAVADEAGTIIARFQSKTEEDPEITIQWIRSMLMGWAQESGLNYQQITAVGAGCPGPLDHDNGIILKAPNLKQWSGYPLRDKLSEKLELHVYLENDADLGAVGEHRYGAGKGYHDIVYITVSTGIGGGIIIQNKLLRGVGNSAGEIGHMTIDPNGPLCGCGNSGCLEALASGTAIVHAAKERMNESWQPDLCTNVLRNSELLSAKTVADLAEKGDPVASEIIRQAMVYLGVGIGNIITTLSPQIVIVGGGVANIGQRMFKPVQEEVRKRVKLVPADTIPIVSAQHLQDAVLCGGIYLALHEKL